MWPEFIDPLGIKLQHLQKLSQFFKDAEEATFDEVSHSSMQFDPLLEFVAVGPAAGTTITEDPTTAQ